MTARPPTLPLLVSLVLAAGVQIANAAPTPRAGCRVGMIEGELNAGKPFSQPIGGGLKLYFQPIQSGWILRILPASGPPGEHDYAELATPPYQSVSPLSISTDFAFRSQDAIGWNPRRFHFATSAVSFRKLQDAYLRFQAGGTTPSSEVQADLASQIAQTSAATLSILDSRLVAGTADQWKMAAAVASHFNSTAHTLVQEPDGSVSALGRIVWLRFRLEFNVPEGFALNPGVHVQPRSCGAT